MRNILKASELEGLREIVGAECYTRLHANRHVCCRAADGYLLSFYFLDIRSAAHREEKITVFCDAQRLIFVTDSKRLTRVAGELQEAQSTFRQLLEFFITLTDGDVDEMEKIEDKVTGIENRLLTMQPGSREENPREIIALRLRLLHLKRYYEQLDMVTGELVDDDQEYNLIPPELKKRFSALDRRMDHLLGSVMHLREYITQVREAYQAQIDIEQNQIMKVFTVISAVFLPLTLIVGWYGMNVQMPEYGWRYGYPFVVGLCVAAVVICYVVFKRKKWF